MFKFIYVQVPMPDLFLRRYIFLYNNIEKIHFPIIIVNV